MPSQAIAPSESLRAGRRALDGIREFSLLEDWEWVPESGSWWLHGRISLELPVNTFIPSVSDWYVKGSPAYPFGAIAFYPASTGGLQHTLPHQNYNGDDPGTSRWRQGRLCVDTGIGSLGRHGYDIEPFDAHRRLAWHVGRLMEWLRAADAGNLVREGDPFELPDFCQKSSPTLAFNETQASLEGWTRVTDSVGLAELIAVPGASQVWCLKSFNSLQGRPLVIMEWGAFLSGISEPLRTALWIRLPSTPVLEPWQAPMTWGEVRYALQEQEVDLDQLLREGVAGIRDGESHFLLLGFPIPEVVGGVPARMHWLATKLPALTVSTPHGFRPTNDRGRWWRDRELVLSDRTPVEWLNTESWSTGELSARGRLAPALVGRRVALIGAGALGSVIAELLVRGGVKTVTVCDGDTLHAGNLVRHTLTLESAGFNKAGAVTRKLNTSSPHAEVTASESYLLHGQDSPPSELASSDLIIDCTGSDDALNRLAQIKFSNPTGFASVSLGMFGKRAFVFSSSGNEFPLDRFLEAVGPWIIKEREENSGTELPWEGVGCWHPLFPARVDDIWMMASAAIKIIEADLESLPREPVLSVIEQINDDGRFVGLRMVHAS